MTAADNTPVPLSPERLAEIRSTLLGDWLAGEWRCRSVDGEPSREEVFLAADGQVLAVLPDWAGNGGVGVFIADAHEAVPELLAELDRVRAERDQLAHELDGVSLAHWEDEQQVAEADFFQIGHTYTNSEFPQYGWKFRADTITTHPEDGERTALGWRFFNGEWGPYAYSEGDWEIQQLVGHTDATADGAS